MSESQQGQQQGPFQLLALEDFSGGLNTNASRLGIKDSEVWWCDGFMPVGESNLRTMHGIGNILASYEGEAGVTWFNFGNIGIVPYCIVVLADGSVHRINVQTGAMTGVFPIGTIIAPVANNIGMTQWGNANFILVAPQTNGYWFIDALLGYGAGTLAPGITITAPGSGYVNPVASVTGGSGTGVGVTVLQSGGEIVVAFITNPGHGYVAGDTPVLTISDAGGPGTGATGDVFIMPFGIQGSAVESYQSRVWVANGATVQFSAPSNIVDFATSSGGGDFTSNDSFLRTAYVGLQQTNGFLYLVGDSSINYIGGVQTSGSPLETTFTNQNADPEVGTPYNTTLQVMGSNMIFANAWGIHVSYGGRVTKVSENLDGVYVLPQVGGGFQPSAAKAIVYGKRIYCVLLNVFDIVLQEDVIKLFCWDQKKWWSTQQDFNLTFIATLEIDSVLTAYGTDGVNIFPLFGNPSTGFPKTVISKLWTRPQGYPYAHASNRAWLVAQYYQTGNPNITFESNTEISSSQVILVPTNTDASLLTSIYVAPPTALSQQGTLLGITLQTTAADVSIISASIDSVPVGYRG